MIRLFAFILIGWLFVPSIFGQTFTPGQSYFGANNYIEYKAGNLPILLSAPHGGLLTPSSIPDRNCSGCTTVNDYNTQELARALYDAIYARSGCYPYMVINRLHRRKLDANRDLPEAADGDPIAGKAWEEFHGFLEQAHYAVEHDFGKGFYIDLHGHGHAVQRLELGYLLSKSELQLSDNTLNTNTFVRYSSIRNLADHNANDLSHAELLHGSESFGSLLSERGYPAVPSAQDPYPDGAEDYFDGGYNTARYSSYPRGAIDGVQIECNRTGVRDSIQQVKRFADSLAVTLLEYLHIHYFGSVQADLCLSANQSPSDTAVAVEVYPNPFCRSFYITQHAENQVLDVDFYDFYGNFLRHELLLPDTPLGLTFTPRQSVYAVLRKNGVAIATKAIIFYCR